jgi:hypothetical protein
LLLRQKAGGRGQKEEKGEEAGGKTKSRKRGNLDLIIIN